MTFPAQIELRPVTIPIEWNGARCLVLCIDLLECVEVDQSRAWISEEAEGDFIFRVRFLQEVVEDIPIAQSDSVLAIAIGNLEEEPILFALDFVLEQAVSANVMVILLIHSSMAHK